MTYQLNKTDGTLLTDLIDGQIDSNSTNLVLVGRNYSGFGEFLNENFIKLLENFANTSSPSNPLEGQLWWDKSESRLKLWNGTQWKTTGTPFVQSSAPQMSTGDLWIDTLNNQLYFFDGSNLILVGPQWNSFQGVTGTEALSIFDTQSRSRSVAVLRIANEIVGIFSNIEFIPRSDELLANSLTGLVTSDNPSGTIRKGFNLLDSDNFKFYGTSLSAESLVSDSGNKVTASQFLPSDRNGITVGTLTVQNSGGLAIGLAQNNIQKVVGNSFYIENQVRDQNLRIRVRSSAAGSAIVDAVFIKADTGHLGIFNNNPEYTLDVGGDLRVTGDLLIEGNTVSVDVANIRVEDKNIELGFKSDSTLLSDAEMDGAGIIARVTGNDKTLIWVQSTNAWTSNQNFDLSSANDTYKIGGVSKITNTSVHPSITQATGLVEIGTLEYLNVDTININNSTISTNSGTSLTINSTGGAISLQTPQRIANVSDPTSAQDVTTKNYVDTKIASQPIIFSLDITGLANPEIQLAIFIENIIPASSREEGSFAFVYTSETSATAQNIDVESTKNISSVAVDSNGTQNESVVQDISFSPASGSVSITVTRVLKRFIVESGSWIFDGNLPLGI